jgi:hypothetical protein
MAWDWPEYVEQQWQQEPGNGRKGRPEDVQAMAEVSVNKRDAAQVIASPVGLE